MASHDHAEQDKGPEGSLAAHEQSGYASRPKCFNSTIQECLFVLTATMAIGQQSFFQGCIVGVTASIGSDLNMNSAEITWINAGASYVLSFCPVVPAFCQRTKLTLPSFLVSWVRNR